MILFEIWWNGFFWYISQNVIFLSSGNLRLVHTKQSLCISVLSGCNISSFSSNLSSFSDLEHLSHLVIYPSRMSTYSDSLWINFLLDISLVLLIFATEWQRFEPKL